MFFFAQLRSPAPSSRPIIRIHRFKAAKGESECSWRVVATAVAVRQQRRRLGFWGLVILRGPALTRVGLVSPSLSLSLSLHLASFARDDAFSSFDRAPHSTQPLPPPAHARLNVSVQHRVNGKIRKPGRISDAYLLPRFTSRPRKASKKEKERRKEFLKTCGRGRGKIFEKTSPFRQEVVIEYGSI